MERFIFDSFAAAAAKASVLLTLSGISTGKVRVATTLKDSLTVTVNESKAGLFDSSCTVFSPCNQDEEPLKITVTTKRTPVGYQICAGENVIISEGLKEDFLPSIPLSITKRTVEQAISAACRDCGYAGGIRAVISIPKDGAVPPSYQTKINSKQSKDENQAIEGPATPETISQAITRIKEEQNSTVLMTPCDYGTDYLSKIIGANLSGAVVIGDYGDFALKAASQNKISGILIVCHLEKAIKYSIGNFSTWDTICFYPKHVLASYAALEGKSLSLVEEIYNCKTAEEAWELVVKSGLSEKVSLRLKIEVQEILLKKFPDICVGVIAFSPKHGIIFKTSHVPLLVGKMNIM